MSEKRNYLKIEEKVFKSWGKIGYILVFTLLFTLIMSLINFILYCFVDNYFTAKFLFKGEMKFSDWWNLMRTHYEFPYFKIGFFSLILLSVAIYRSKILSRNLSK